MNLKFSNKASDDSFSNSMNNADALKKWLMYKITGYTSHSERVTMEICIDGFTKGDMDSYDWAIYSEPMDNYGIVLPLAPKNPIINGGLIYRGLDEHGDHSYSSHT